MTETYEFKALLQIEGTVHGYSKLDAYNSLRDLERWSYDTFEDSLLGRVDFAEFYLKVDTIVPKAPEPEQVILPDNRMWLP